MATYRLEVLGPLRLVADDGTNVALRPAQRRLLAALAVSGRQGRSIAGLTDALWGEEPPSTAHNTIQVHVSGIRRSAPDSVATMADRYAIGDAIVTIDAHDFEAAGDIVLGDPGTTGWEEVRATAEAALDLWRGDPYVEVPDDALAEARRRHLDELRMSITERHAEAMIALGAEDAALPLLAELTELHPLRERLWEFLMVCQYRLGRQAEALRAFRRASGILGEELGIEPGPRLRDLEEEILRHVADAGKASLAVTPTNLPRLTGPILGRETDAERLVDELERHRLVSLTGSSGVGKTRLAVDVGWRMLDRLAGGVFMIDLANASDESSMVAAIATALRLTADVGDASLLADALRGRPLLVILDGADHLQTPLSMLCARVAGSPGPTILTTSRRTQRIPGAQVIRLDPLALPDQKSADDELRAAPALRLLLERARTASDEFRAEDVPLQKARRILERTEGNPLALEIAGRWVATLGADAYLELRERFPGAGAHGDIELAVNALAPVDRRFLFDISVVAGHGSLATFEAIGAPDRDPVELAGSVARLVDAGLLTTMASPTGMVRYAIPAAIGEIVGTEIDRRTRIDEVRRRHAHHFLAVAQGIESATNVDIDLMMPDFRMALDWWLAHDPGSACTIANALAPYWVAQYLTWDGLHWYGRIIDALGEPDLDTLWWSGWMAYNANEHTKALQRYEELADRAPEGTLHHARAVYGEARLSAHSDRSVAESNLDRSLAVFRSEGSDRDVTECLLALGMSKAGTGAHERARPLLDEALDLLGPSGDARQRALCHRFLSLAAYHDGDVDAAMLHADRAVTIAEEAADVRIWCGTLLQLALVEATWGSIPDSARTVAAALEPVPSSAWYDTMLVLNGALPVLDRGGEPETARSVVQFIDQTMRTQGWQPLQEVNPVYAAVRSSLGPIPDGTPSITDVREQAERALTSIAAS